MIEPLDFFAVSKRYVSSCNCLMIRRASYARGMRLKRIARVSLRSSIYIDTRVLNREYSFRRKKRRQKARTSYKKKVTTPEIGFVRASLQL